MNTRQLRPSDLELIGDMPPSLPGVVVVRLDECLSNRGGDHDVLSLGNVGQHIAHRMNPTLLPCRTEDAGDGGLQPFMSIGDHQFDAGEAPAHQIAQEARPERLSFRRADMQPDDLALALGADGDRGNAAGEPACIV